MYIIIIARLTGLKWKQKEGSWWSFFNLDCEGWCCAKMAPYLPSHTSMHNIWNLSSKIYENLLLPHSLILISYIKLYIYSYNVCGFDIWIAIWGKQRENMGFMQLFAVCEYISRSILVYPLFFGFLIRKYFFLPSHFFRVYENDVLFYYFYSSYFKDVSPHVFLHGDCTRNHTEKSIGPTKSISDKKA